MLHLNGTLHWAKGTDVDCEITPISELSAIIATSGKPVYDAVCALVEETA
jgi:hypothetical protein